MKWRCRQLQESSTCVSSKATREFRSSLSPDLTFVNPIKERPAKLKLRHPIQGVGFLHQPKEGACVTMSVESQCVAGAATDLRKVLSKPSPNLFPLSSLLSSPHHHLYSTQKFSTDLFIQNRRNDGVLYRRPVVTRLQLHFGMGWKR